jgi:PIN domain nuclease of toxin-antitoxin system
LGNETGAEAALEYAGEAAISAVNLAEVVAKLSERGFESITIQSMLGNLGLEVIPFDEPLAVQSGLLRSSTRHLGLSLGDRACLALAQHLGLPCLTADLACKDLRVGFEIRTLR